MRPGVATQGPAVLQYFFLWHRRHQLSPARPLVRMNAAPRASLHTTIEIASCRPARHEMLHPRPSSTSHRIKQFTALWPWVRSMLSSTQVFLMAHRTLLSLGIDPAPHSYKVERFTAIWPCVIPMGFMCRGCSSQFGRAAHPNLVVAAHTPPLTFIGRLGH